MENELIEKMKVVLADAFILYFKAHAYHWNVIGPDFPQLHTFFGNLYEEVHDSIDAISEHIRALDSFAPGSLSRIIELSTVTEDTMIPTTSNMLKNLLTTNENLLTTLREANTIAEESNQIGTANFLQERIDIHEKHNWMLKATLKKS